MPKISVIVPAYKVESFLSEGVDSILRQTFDDFELILIDDGSSDACSIIEDAYLLQDTRIMVIHQTNGGLSVARNNGIEVAIGEYIAFIDGDDFVTPSYLDVLYNACIDYNVQISCCKDFNLLERKNVKELNDSQFKLFDNKAACLNIYSRANEIQVVACEKLFHRELFKNLRFKPGIFHEDQDLIPKLLYLSNGVVFVNSKMYCYRIREDSITHDTFNLKRFDNVAAIDSCINFFEEHGEKDIVKAATNWKIIRNSTYFLHAKNAGFLKDVPKSYKMNGFTAIRNLYKLCDNGEFEYYLSIFYPKLVMPYAYFRKIKKILHIPCKK